jgi:uncharacterized protein YcbK (DUF882 family)
LQFKGSRLGKGERRAIAAALLSVLLASCTSTTDPTLSVAMPGYNAAATDLASSSTPANATTGDSAVAAADALTSGEGDVALPDQVAYMPTMKPGGEQPVPMPAATAEVANAAPQQQEAATAPAAATAPQEAGQQVAEATPAKPAATPEEAAQTAEFYVTATEPPVQEAAPKKKGFLASLFGATPASAAPAPKPKAVAPAEPAKPIITLASAEPAKPIIASAAPDTHNYTTDALPGVRQTALFEIKRKSGLDDESDIDLNEEEDFGAYQVASAAGLARLAPNGLLKQTERVDVACLKPSLVRVLKTIEGHYGKKLMVTSGYRDPARNRRARGAKNSLHMYCAAADIQVPGVSKWELANYLRSMPGRGGVGTYCHTDSVHVDVGPERDWNWRCRRRK